MQIIFQQESPLNGTKVPTAWNGGGRSGDSGRSGTGGGMTHISYKNNPVTYGQNWDPDGTIIVAGGGGGGGNGSPGNTGNGYRQGGYAGGDVAENGHTGTAESTNGGKGANNLTPVTGSKQGNGEDHTRSKFTSTNSDGSDGGGGGGGWYGGLAGKGDVGGGGGTGYVSPELVNAKNIAGNTSITEPGGTTNTGHEGDGYARITYAGTTIE